MSKHAPLLKNPIHFLSLGFGLGLAPKAPGTFGTFAALPFIYLFSVLDTTEYVGVVVAFALLGIYLCGATSKAMKAHDHPAIVWDEVVGYMIAMIAVPVTWLHLLVAFVLFRFFDILKPWPIKALDKHVKGGFGIMIDDVIAGVFSLVIIHLLMLYGWLPAVA